MKKIMFFAALAAVIGLASCSKHAEKQETVYTFQCVCSHLCKHGGRKALLMGTQADTIYTDNDTIIRPRILRVEGAKMGNFDAACINNIVRVKGVLHAFEIQPEPVTADNPAEQHGTDGNGCETEKAAIKGYYAEAVSYQIINE